MSRIAYTRTFMKFKPEHMRSKEVLVPRRMRHGFGYYVFSPKSAPFGRTLVRAA